MTQLEKARNNEITREMKSVAEKELIDAELLRQEIAKGRCVITKNRYREINPIGIGRILKTKINANIGTSPNKADINEELEKLKVCEKYGADTVMDLSTGGDLNKIRKTFLENSSIPFGTVSIYQAMVENDNSLDISEDEFIDTIELHAKQGVDFITVHCGITLNSIPLLKNRITGVVSRGGSFLVKWMKHNKKENPFYSNFDAVLEIAKKYDVVLSLGDGLRSGCLHDATDKAQLHELKILGELTKRAWSKDVQVIIEGPGHVPLNMIEKNMKMQEKYCHGAPFYVLGPLVTDIAPGYDHITSAIGSALAAYHGASFLCYVTSAEHLRLPNIDEVKEGIIASKIAAHAADIARGIKNSRNIDDEFSKARFNLEWEKQFKLALDPETARKKRKEAGFDIDSCTMCGKFCSMKK